MMLEKINKNVIDRDRMRVIFDSMTKEQQSAQNVRVFRFSDYVFPKIVPTEKEFENFKDPTKYGVWINGKKVKNSDLNKYKASDFSQFGISKLWGGAKYDHGVKRIYGYLLDMMTKNYYEKYRKEALADTEQRYMIRDLGKLKAGILSK
jgi:bla regulator protein blaR1